MKEHPILFSSEMVKAILNGSKSQTRRVITKANSKIGERGDWANLCWDGSAIYHDIPVELRLQHLVTDKKAPLPFVDPGFGDHTYQYLHVPYRWAEDQTIYRVYPRIEPGDRLWVRETWAPDNAGGIVFKADGNNVPSWMTADGREIPCYWKPSIFMPRCASRITLEVVSVKPERLQNITEGDAVAEGMPLEEHPFDAPPAMRFATLWDSINGKKHPWASNPFCWRIEFKRVEAR